MNQYEILKKYFGYDSFRQGQEELIEAALNGQDVLGIMPTGAGKSICYQVPALMMKGITLVISPLISLMKDQVQALNQAGVHAAYINSSLTEAQIARALQLAAELRYKIIYVAPERLETCGFLEFVRRVEQISEISMLTVDEAHCISQWGQDFRPSYLKIVQFLKTLEKRPVVSAFTATATERVKEDIVCVLGLLEPKTLVTGFDRANLYFGVETPAKKDDYVQQYVKAHERESGIIYCATRKNVEKLYEKLTAKGIPVTKYHAGLPPKERQENQEDFIYDRCPVMVATNAFGMGIDKSNVRYVLHYNMPQSLENYYQEAGRAGRDGEPSECILLYSPQDVVINRFLLDGKEPNPAFQEEENRAVRERDEERLRSMERYCRLTDCLRKYVLRYFGEYQADNCGNCSACRQEYETEDVTEQTGKILSCVMQLRGRYGINVVAGTLCGSERAKLREYGLLECQGYGSLKNFPEAEVKQLIQFLLSEGFLETTKDKYALVRLTRQGMQQLESGMPVMMRKVKRAFAAKSTPSARRSDILNSRGLALFERLRGVRSGLAKEAGIPPYLVFSDKSLVDMCVRTPMDEGEMLKVNGVGQNKYERYGMRFLQEISDFTGGRKEKLYFGEMPQTEETKTAQTGGTRAGTVKAEFFLTFCQAMQFPYTEHYLAPEMAKQLSNLRDADTVKKVTGADIFRKMQENGYASEVFENGRWKKCVSPEGEKAGLFLGMRTSQKGTEYEDIFYNEKAQRMIVEYYTREDSM